MKSNYIFIPKQEDITQDATRAFLFPAEVTRRHISKKNENCEIIVAKNSKPLLDYFGINNLSYESFFPHVQPGANLIFFHSGESEPIAQILFEVSKRVPLDNISISLLPDGFGNAHCGGYLLDELNKRNHELNNLTLFKVYSFGFIHKYSLRDIPLEKREVINYSHLRDFLEKNPALQKFYSAIDSSLNYDSDIIFIPYRPWCTEEFHKGKYLIGDQNFLAEIYNQIIELIINNENLERPTILIRGDYRYKKYYEKLLLSLDKFQSFINIDNFYPEDYSLEPFLFHLSRRASSRKIFHLTLDSNSFQPIPYLIERLERCHQKAYIGCLKEFFNTSRVPTQELERVLKIKIQDFHIRHKNLIIENKLSSTSKLSEHLLKSEIIR